jgi:hypothetical protein
MKMKKFVLVGMLTSLLLSACGGGGGSAGTSNGGSNAIQMPGTVSVNTPYAALPLTLTGISYPSSYTSSANITSVSVCDVDSNSTSYPINWTGPQNLPSIANSTLNSSFQTLVNIKDILPDGSLPVVCANPNNISEFVRTLSRLKALRTDIITLSQWHWAKINSDGSFSITGDTSGSLSDAQLTQYVNAAHAAGVKVMLANQIQGFVDSTGNIIQTPAGNSSNYTLWLNAFQPFMLNRATFFQSLAVDFWEMGCNSCIYMDAGDNSASAVAIFAAAYESMLPRVSEIFKGKRYISGNENILTSNVLSYIDYIAAGLWTNNNYTVSSETAVNVSDYKSNLSSNISSLMQYNKPIMVDVGIQSRANALSEPGYLEETECTSSIGSLGHSNTCIQQQTATNFSLQAIVIEAQFEYISSQSLPSGSIVRVSDYWQTDFMNQNNQGPTFPNLGYSIRNKPAESIVGKWFLRNN